MRPSGLASVGWVERSDTHHPGSRHGLPVGIGCAPTQPTGPPRSDALVPSLRVPSERWGPGWQALHVAALGPSFRWGDGAWGTGGDGFAHLRRLLRHPAIDGRIGCASTHPTGFPSSRSPRRRPGSRAAKGGACRTGSRPAPECPQMGWAGCGESFREILSLPVIPEFASANIRDPVPQWPHRIWVPDKRCAFSGMTRQEADLSGRRHTCRPGAFPCRGRR